MVSRKLLSLFTIVLLLAVIAVPVAAKKNAKIDQAKTTVSRIGDFNLQTGNYVMPNVKTGMDISDQPRQPRHNVRGSLGSAASASAGPGIGQVIDNTWFDEQAIWQRGTNIATSVNGTDVDVHFVYTDLQDTLGTATYDWDGMMSGYQVYDANTGTWPLGLEQGCELQTLDTAGFGRLTNLSVMDNGLVVIGALNQFFSGILTAGTGNGEPWENAGLYYQASRHDCLYSSTLNYTFVDSSVTQPFRADTTTNQIKYPIIEADVVGGTPVVHLVLQDGLAYRPPNGSDYVNNLDYFPISYYRKDGTGTSGSWGNAQAIDTTFWYFIDLVASPFSDEVAITYTNSSVWGRLLNQENDLDVFYRESTDGGATWPAKVNVSNYQNPIPGDPAHAKTWLHAQALYTSVGDLHIVWHAEPTSADPYNDGFNWANFGENLYHWSRATGDIVKIANGTFTDDEFLGSGVNTFVCDFPPANSGYIAWLSISECDGNLYTFWNQWHDRANHLDWENDTTALNDCGRYGTRFDTRKANAEIFMSVSTSLAGSLWDEPRNLTDSYTPNCALPGDPEATAVCGNEHKPKFERYGLDESGLTVTWPGDALVDPAALVGEPVYTGDYYLNGVYIDDQYPGPRTRDWGDIWSYNSMKWLRVACVDPIEAPLISASPGSISWPEWVKVGQSANHTITVTNNGNVTLNVATIGTSESSGPGGWLGTTAPGGFSVTAGVSNTATFDITINAAGASSPEWLDGTVTVNSNATNNPTLVIDVHVLAADTVVAPTIDTVGTDAVFDVASKGFAPTVGERIGIGVYSNSATASISAGVAGNGISMDYGLSGEECGERARDSLYNAGASPFVLMASESASVPASVSLTTSFGHNTSGPEHGWDPAVSPTAPSSGLAGDASYDSVYTGRAVNRDTTIAIEKTFYAPRTVPSGADPGEWIVMKSVFYSADGGTYSHVTIGNATDWDVPSDSIPDNVSGASVSGNFVYQQGVDTTAHENPTCLNSTRFAAEAMILQYNLADCGGTQTTDYWGALAFDQLLIEDTNQERDATPIDPPQPDGKAWWEEINDNPGISGNTTASDQAIWMAYQHDVTVTPSDTFVVWSVYSTVRDGALSDLEANMDEARTWFNATFSPCGVVGCCDGVRGDANCNGEIAVSDIGILVDHLFISGSALCCFEEADANGNGEIAVSDIGIIVEKLFIGGTEPPACP